jgi:RHS repeat-associated protein
VNIYTGFSQVQVASVGIPYQATTTMRTVMNKGIVGVYINNVLVLSYSGLYDNSSYAAGIGMAYSPSGSSNAITQVNLGFADTTGPTAIPSSSIGVSPFPSHVDLQWPAAVDPNGIGIMQYEIWRNGLKVGTTSGLTYSDTTVVPETTYSYTLKADDYFQNQASTTFSVTTPAILTNPPYPSATPEGRRVGIQTTGAYWGTMGENIDVRSGNLSFSVPLLAAQGRGGWKAGFSLSYNSQNWRQDSGGTWQFDGDMGYGFGWRLQAGSVMPVWNAGGMTAAYFLFIDSTGAEYRLDQNTNNVWGSKGSVYVWFDANANTLHFRDGSFWHFGCISASTEADSGVMYPTLMQDPNGNQINIAYLQAPGAGWTNSSGRISSITDVRTQGTYPSPTYTFTYNSDTPPHLTGISNSISSNEYFTFTYLAGQTLSSPFGSQSFGTTTLLSAVNGNLLHNGFRFTYDSSGEATQITLPQSGYFAYNYTTTTYSSGRSYREVATRYLSKDGSTQTAYPFSHEPSPGSDVHQYTILDDPGGLGEKYWAFATSGVAEGLVTQYQGRQLPGPVVKTQNDFTWVQDSIGNSYIGNTLKTTDVGQSYQVQSQTAQMVDIYGNVTQTQQFNYGNLTTPGRTYNYTYLNSSVYLGEYMYNRLLTAAVTDGTNNVTIATYQYDNNYCYTGPCPGNMTSASTPAGFQTLQYNSKGNVTNSTMNGVTTSLTFNSSTNYAAPSQANVGSLSATMNYNSFLGLTSETGPNGDTTGAYWTDARGPASVTSPFGATTTYGYSGTVLASTKINNRQTQNTLDGLGRTISSISGTLVNGTSTPLSQVDTVYGSCGCSPTGKMMQTSLPHVPGATPVWTTYTYDGIGRTVSVLLPDGASQTTYVYQGNVVTVTDPAGNWKQYTSDAFGRLTQVQEPNPVSGSTFGNYFTYYTYDLLDHLTQVSMPRPTGTQTRTFVYSGKYLQSATNPENGTVTYTWAAPGKIASKTDAKGQKIVYTYDSYFRLTNVSRYPAGSQTEDPNQHTYYYYDSNPFNSSYSTYTQGRLAAVQYSGGNCSNGTCDTIQEMFSYSAAAGVIGKRLHIIRSGGYAGDLWASWTYDNEGHVTGVTYPQWQNGNSVAPGSNYTYGFDNMGRLNTMTDALNNNNAMVTGVTYGAANEMQQLSVGYYSSVNYEARTYNSMFQLTGLSQAVGHTGLQYTYSATQNNGKILSQTDTVSGEQVTYTYDALNRLASAVTTDNPNVTQWGQSYNYDGFGNLTNQNVIKGSAPTLAVTYDPTTNRRTGETADANGNIGGYPYVYDIENRLVGATGYDSYAYDPSNKRMWHGNSSQAIDEITFWGVTGQKMGTYHLNAVSTGYPTYQNLLQFSLTSTNVYFGGKLVAKGTVNSQNGTVDMVQLTAVASDRLGSIGKFYPFGQEKPSATANDTEKFTGYFRDASTGLDYADQRYHQPGRGRFMTPDPYQNSAGPQDPGSWNRYAYTRGDPVNRIDPTGLDDCDNDPWDCQDSGGIGGMPSGCYYAGQCGDPLVDDGTLVNGTSVDVSDTADPVDAAPLEVGYSVSITVLGKPFQQPPGTTPCLQDVTPGQGQQIINNASKFIGTAYGYGPNQMVCTGLACRAIRPLIPGFPEGVAGGWGNHSGLRPLRAGEPTRAGDVIRFPGHVGLYDPGHNNGRTPMLSATNHGVMWTNLIGFGAVQGFSRVQVPCN